MRHWLDCVGTLSLSLLYSMLSTSVEFVGIGLLPSLPNSVMGGMDDVPLCARQTSVCGTVLRIGETIKVYEGPYCDCGSSNNNCSDDWNSNEFGAFTWHHHERVDWSVQYQFCSSNAMDAEKPGYCNSLAEMNEIVSVIRVKKLSKKLVASVTIKSSWLPFLYKHDCMCRGGTFFMHSWMLAKEGGVKGENGEEKEKEKSYWEYNYTCDMELCKRDDPCNKHYMDRSKSHAMGYRFLCSCPQGFYCPSGKEGKVKAYDIDDADEVGPFLWGYCQPVAGWDVEKQEAQED